MREKVIKWAFVVIVLAVLITVITLLATVLDGNIGTMVAGGAMGLIVLHLVEHELGEVKK